MPSKFSIGSSNFPNSHADSRNDLGYGRANPKYHVPKQLGDVVYPYKLADEDVDDVEIDDDTMDAVASQSGPDGNNDPYGGHYDPFYYVGGNTKLGEAVVSGMVPFPGMYKNNYDTATGGSQYGGRTARADASTNAPTLDTGERWGWTNIPDQYEDEEDEPIDNLEHLALKQLREVIRGYLLRKL